MKAGIWGWFQTGNYGDELMPIYLASVLRELGVDSVAFSVRPEVAARHGFETTDDIDVFFADIDVCLFAEGGCLVDAGDCFNEKADRYVRMAAAARRNGVPIYPMSLGGNGTGVGAVPKGGLADLWREGVFGQTVVRLPGDVALIESFGGTAAFVPDMLWEAATALGVGPRSRGESRPIRVGLNFLRRLVPEGFERWVAENVPDGVEIVWLAVHTEKRVKGELRAETESGRVKIFRHDDPLELLEALGTLDVIVSSKLHVGLTALTRGTVFVSCHGRPKTHAQLALLNPALVMDEVGAGGVLARLFADPVGELAALRALVPWDEVFAQISAAAENRAWVRRHVLAAAQE